MAFKFCEIDLLMTIILQFCLKKIVNSQAAPSPFKQHPEIQALLHYVQAPTPRFRQQPVTTQAPPITHAPPPKDVRKQNSDCTWST